MGATYDIKQFLTEMDLVFAILFQNVNAPGTLALQTFVKIP